MSEPAITYEDLLKGVETAIQRVEAECQQGIHDDFSTDRGNGAGLAVLELRRDLTSAVVAAYPSMGERIDADTDRIADRVIPF